MNTTSILYNAPKATINVTGKSVASWEQSVFTKGAIYNFGELTIQEGALKFNSQDATCYFYNGTEATINTPTFIIGGIGVNDGTVNAQKISNDNGVTLLLLIIAVFMPKILSNSEEQAELS